MYGDRLGWGSVVELGCKGGKQTNFYTLDSQETVLRRKDLHYAHIGGEGHADAKVVIRDSSEPLLSSEWMFERVPKGGA